MADGKQAASNIRNRKRNRIYKGVLLTAGLISIALVSMAAYNVRTAVAPQLASGETELAVPIPKAAVELRMTDLDNGWVRYEDAIEVAGVKRSYTEITTDGGLSWKAAPSAAGASASTSAPAGTAAGTTASTAAVTPDPWADLWAPPAQPQLTTLTLASKPYKVKQSQFLTSAIGWAIVESDSAEPLPPLVTVDGGKTWLKEATPDVKQALEAEKKRRSTVQLEAQLYENAQAARQAMSSSWKLFPATAYIGDAVLVRHDGPGEVAWQGATYKLQPYGAGYFTYLPVSLSVKPGTYTIGDQVLTIKSKKFETQYLQVTQEMEEMKQDTARILADQKKIDAARSKSAPEFLFDSEFIKPIEGILTTPYGYTRYVNNKYDSSHLALDLAAKQGTPIKATNDGIVVLAETLYLTGNAIYIDHGMGLFSQYAHMLQLNVKTGDKVKKGDIIGLVGTTGFSTGPHLHFTFWMHNVQANPDIFFGTNPFRWQSAK